MDWIVNGTNKGLPRRLTRLRNEAGLTRQELADKAGVTFNTINDIERGRRRRPMEKTLQTIAEALGVSYEYLVHGTGPPSAMIDPVEEARPSARSRATRVVMVAAIAVIAGVGFLHARWERSQSPFSYDCIVKCSIEGADNVQFDDIDGCGMVEAIYDSGENGEWTVSRVDRTEVGGWQLSPLFTRPSDGPEPSSVHTHDVNGDGWKDLLNLYGAGADGWIEVLDGRTGEMLAELHDPYREAAGPEPTSGVETCVEAITHDTRRNSDIALISTTGQSSSSSDVLRGIEVTTGGEVFRYESDDAFHHMQVADTDLDGRHEVFIWSLGDGLAGAPGQGFVTAIDDRGRLLWRRSCGRGAGDLPGCVLTGDDQTPAVVLAAANKLDDKAHDPSYLLLLDASSGARVDSLPYTNPIVNEVLFRRAGEDGGWHVFCGTRHGSVRRYLVRDNHIRLEDETIVDDDWVWTWGFVAGDDEEDRIIVATASDVSFIVDVELDVLLKRRGLDGAPISPLASFTDGKGEAFVAFLCHGNDLCIDRIVPSSRWGRRAWYLVGYLLPLAAVVVSRRVTA